MHIRVGYEFIYNCLQPTPMILTVHIHFTRVSDLIVPDHLITNPSIPITAYRDAFGNWCSRIVAPQGELRLAADAVVNDTGASDSVAASVVHHHVVFGYEHARATRTALETLNEGIGVCRDYAHLAIAFCRCMNIPARYCTGYLGDIGIPPPYGPMDFAAWFEAYLGGHWYTFDARNNLPRIGRVLIARGRDAADVAISNTFGPNTLTSFKVWAEKCA
jgi:transglutaminase-like putative cysteine protease